MKNVGRLVALLAVALWGCSGSSSPTAPLPSPARPAPASPTPAPTPEGVTTKSCTVPDNHPEAVNCAFNPNNGNGYFFVQVYDAIAKLREQKPEIFDGTHIRQVNKYFDGVIRILAEDNGLCAVRGGPPDEIGIKESNKFSEQYDILAHDVDGNPLTNWDYTATCKPARF